MSGGNNSTLLLIAAIGAGIATGGLALAPAAAAAGAGGAAGAGAAAAGASAFSWAGALQGGAAFLSAGTALMSGQAQATAYKAQKANVQLQTAADQAQSSVEELQRQKLLRSTLSTQRAIFGASNLDAGSGALLAEKTMGSVNTNTNYGDLMAKINGTQGAMQADQYGSAASAAELGGVAQASGTLLQFAGQKYNRTKTT